MARYRMEDGTVIDTDRATRSWEEATYHNGHNFVSRVTHDEFRHQCLYQSRKGRYYIEHTSQWQGSRGSVEWVSPQEATRWLLANEREPHELPEDLQALVDDIVE